MSTDGPTLTTILLVEDDPTVRTVMARLIVRQGYRVLQARDAEAALLQVACERPDMILMDIYLPGLDGLEATRLLRASPATRNIPIIAISARAMRPDRLAAIAAGCDEFASKPLHLAQLVETMQTLWGNRVRTPGRDGLPLSSYCPPPSID